MKNIEDPEDRVVLKASERARLAHWRSGRVTDSVVVEGLLIDAHCVPGKSQATYNPWIFSSIFICLFILFSCAVILVAANGI